MIMLIAPNSRAHKGEKEMREEEGNADYGGMVQPSQRVAPCLKGLSEDWARDVSIVLFLFFNCSIRNVAKRGVNPQRLGLNVKKSTVTIHNV